jgi:hypothetical protein
MEEQLNDFWNNQVGYSPRPISFDDQLVAERVEQICEAVRKRLERWRLCLTAGIVDKFRPGTDRMIYDGIVNADKMMKRLRKDTGFVTKEEYRFPS